jgi:hypothetical protein
MKKVLLLALGLAFAGVGAAQAQSSASATGSAGTAKVAGPQIQFDEVKYDFNSVVQGGTVDHTFKFKNVGTAPLIISNIGVSCGCTTPEWTKDPIAPGKTGTISAHFNSAGKMGMQNKVLTIDSNSVGGSTTVALVGEVKEPGEAAAAAVGASTKPDATTMSVDGKQKNKLDGSKIKAKKKKA